MISLPRHTLRSFTIGFALVLAGLVVVVAQSGNADAAVNQGVVVPETPRTNTPIVLDGKVRAHAQVGNRIFVGGDFQQVELPNGSVITQPYLFAYDIDTGLLDPNFRPVLNKQVRSLEATPAGDGLYVGGQFSSWDASFPLRIAKLDALGNLDPSFNATADARVQSIAARGDKVFIGGDFNNVSGAAHRGIAALDATTGAVDAGFSIDIGSSVSGSQLAKTVLLTNDGNTLFVMHYGSTIEGQVREAVAKIDVSGANATLSGWNIPWSAQEGNRLCLRFLRDMAISPDSSFIVIGGQGADNPPNCDSVLKYSTAGTSTVNFLWSARMYSSVYSLAVSDVAIYVGGHFCAAPRNPIPAGGVSSTWPGTANFCDVNDPNHPLNPSVLDSENAVFRQQLAALDPVTGQALSWDPGSNNFEAVFDLTLIDRGLLAGQDRDRFNDVRTGRSGFFDIGGAADTTPPTMLATSPASGSVVQNPTELRGTATDNIEIASVTLRLKNVTTDLWLQPNGTFAATQADLPPNLTVVGLGAVDWDYPVTNLPDGDYEIRGFSTDTSGNTSPSLVSPFLIPSTTSCTVALDVDDQPVITWVGFSDGVVNTVFVRRDGSWLANGAAGNSSYTDTTALPGDHSYVIRWRPGGVATDVACTPDPITVPAGGGPTCSVGLDANSKPILVWDAVAGVNTYNVRDEGGWVATVAGGTTYTDNAAVPGDHTYTVRYNLGGQNNITCTPDPITVPQPGGVSCTVALNGLGEVVVNWTEVPGEDTYQVRDAAIGWIATVVGAFTYTDTDPEPGARTYVMRYRQGGQNIDTICSPDPINV